MQPDTNNPNLNEYLQKRLDELSISEKENTFTRVWYTEVSQKDDEGNALPATRHEQTRDYKIFDSDLSVHGQPTGNIRINYFNLDGQPYRWKKEDTKQSRDFYRLRLKEPKGSAKYIQGEGSPVYPFFPPRLIKKYERAKAGSDEGKIDVLYLIEGEFKAFKASMLDIDIVGLPGIHGFYNSDFKGALNEDIQELIITCKVNKIVLLYDADFLTVNWAEGKDLAKRPESFYGAIKAFRESLQQLIDDERVALEFVYYMHIKSKYLNDAKGLDDLLVKYPDRAVEIQEDLFSLSLARKYFDGYQINDLNKDVNGRLYRYLGLTDEQEFYKTYKDFIGAREFKFKRRRYVYDEEKKEVAYVRHEDTDKYMRIGPDWVKTLFKPNKHGILEQSIIKWKLGEIQRDYKRYPDFIDHIPKYDDFYNEPCWNENYKRIIVTSQSRLYNVCEPLAWTPKEGSIEHSIAFLKHLFQGSGVVTLDDKGIVTGETCILGDPFTVALDWLTILYRHPKQMLPVPILVSTENYTGKSTFLKWLQMIYGQNACILGNEQFKMKFNGHYITKFIIGIDEGFLDVDKKAEKERLKQLVTSDTQYLENKGMNVVQIPYYGKVVICSNDADRVMKIEEGESRWFVVKVPTVDKSKMDKDLELKMRSEVDAFLHFLGTRHIAHPNEHRLWFKPERFITDQFKLIVETTKNRIDRVFEEWIREQFLTYRLAVLKYPLNKLTEFLNDQKTNKYKVDTVDLKAYLSKRGMKPDDKVQKIKIPVGFTFTDDARFGAEIRYERVAARPYVFRLEDWTTEEQQTGVFDRTDETESLEDMHAGKLNAGRIDQKAVTNLSTATENTDDEPYKHW